MLVKGLAPNGRLDKVGQLIQALTKYADLIDPWAHSVSALMLADVERRDSNMWRIYSRAIGRELQRELLSAPTGSILLELQSQQVRLIKSIPLDAAERVHRLAEQNIVSGTRASELAKEIMSTESVSKAKATLIARTEVSRAASNLVQARATHAGSEGYFWRTSGDSDVRPSHAAMDGKYVRWTEPPILDKMKGHAGCLPNCRCYAEPQFPDF